MGSGEVSLTPFGLRDTPVASTTCARGRGEVGLALAIRGGKLFETPAGTFTAPLPWPPPWPPRSARRVATSASRARASGRTSRALHWAWPLDAPRASPTTRGTAW